jgi:hypothetical protein
MRKIVIVAGMGAALALPSSAAAFHHASIPASSCASESAGSPSNGNGMALEHLNATKDRRGGEAAGLPLPPIGTPGAFQGQGDENCSPGR